MLFAEFQFVVDKELAADDKEQNDACYNVGSVLVQFILCGNLNGSLLHEYKQEGNDSHHPDIKFGQPGDDDGCEASAS